MRAEGLANNGLVERQHGEVVIRQGRNVVVAQDSLLFLVELFYDIWARGEAGHDLGTGSGRRVLTSHEESDHHVGDFLIGDWRSVLVC